MSGLAPDWGVWASECERSTRRRQLRTVPPYIGLTIMGVSGNETTLAVNLADGATAEHKATVLPFAPRTRP